MKIKICGLKQADHAQSAISAGADFLGCVFFEPSPRNVSFDQARAVFETTAGTNTKRVGLFVNPTDGFLDAHVTEVGLDVIQLHGAETPDRVRAVQSRFGLPVMKALAIGGAQDVEQARLYDGVADYLLFDAKPPKGATRPGGNALAFDWQLLANSHWQSPWLLAGGLTPDNISEALTQVTPDGVDVSSGVEVSKGLKSPELIQTFIRSVKESSS